MSLNEKVLVLLASRGTESYPRQGCGVRTCNNGDPARWVCDSEWSFASFSLLPSMAQHPSDGLEAQALYLPTLGPCSNLSSISMWFGRETKCQNSGDFEEPENLHPFLATLAVLEKVAWNSEMMWRGR